MVWHQWIVHIVELIFLGLGTYFDMKQKALPLTYLGIFLCVGIFFNIIWNYQKPEMIVGGVVIGGVFLVIGKLTKEAIGYGDGLSFMILGIFEGWRSVLDILGIAFLLSGIFGVWKVLRKRGKANDTIPFLPFLLLAKMGEMIV